MELQKKRNQVQGYALFRLGGDGGNFFERRGSNGKRKQKKMENSREAEKQLKIKFLSFTCSFFLHTHTHGVLSHTKMTSTRPNALRAGVRETRRWGQEEQGGAGPKAEAAGVAAGKRYSDTTRWCVGE
jgi:hypothetical protein